MLACTLHRSSSAGEGIQLYSRIVLLPLVMSSIVLGTYRLRSGLLILVITTWFLDLLSNLGCAFVVAMPSLYPGLSGI
ncbi:hypothetical protein M404DRAFT_1001087 [Pisolithus tinctorius Marx 270]|uniref:Uncharacterized protein n=1 Tax=Pisolithus tinctorius Marx 270 TaxID=870435 RepID=A0A0C3NSR3_PISTI|nr:hypothetical protein M404DRAFT_1001087 [Pisolithus tinctorius Marx 270]